MMMVGMNYALILGAALLRMVVGFVWYTSLFGKEWKEEVRKNRREAPRFTHQVAMLSNFISSVLMAFVLYTIAQAAHSMTFQQGIFLGFFAWLGFVVPATIGAVFYEGDSFKLFLIHTGYQVITLMLMGGVIAQWSCCS